MSRKFFLTGLVIAICLFLGSKEGAAQLTGGNTGANQQNNQTGGLIGGNATGNAGGGLIGGGSTAGQANTGQGLRATGGNFQNLSAIGGGNTGATNTGRGGQATRQFGGGAGGRGGARGTGGGARGGGQVQSTRRVIRPVLRIAFTYPTPAPRVESSLNRQFDRVSVRLKNRFRYLALKVGDKGVVTLTGQVQSDNDKKLAAAYVRLEPGVRKIENNLIVTATR